MSEVFFKKIVENLPEGIKLNEDSHLAILNEAYGLHRDAKHPIGLNIFKYVETIYTGTEPKINYIGPDSIVDVGADQWKDYLVDRTFTFNNLLVLIVSLSYIK